MFSKLKHLFWCKRRFIIVFSGLLVSTFFIIQIYSSFQLTRLKIAAGPARGESYQLAHLIAKQLINYHSKVRLEVLETKGSEQNLELLQSGQVDLASVPVTSSVSGSARVVSYLFNDLFHIVVSKESGIKKIADLKGKRIAIPVSENKADDFFWILLKHYRLSQSDIQAQSMTGEEADQALLDGYIDAIFRARPSGNKFIQKLVQATGANIIPIDQAAALKIQYPEFSAATLPKGTYQGNAAVPIQDLETISVQRMLLSSSQVSTESIYEMVKTIYDNRQFLTSQMPLSNEMFIPDPNGKLPMPIHSGAANYYKRSEPDFLTKNSDLIGLVVTVILAAASWLWQLKEQFSRIQKNQSDVYNNDLIQMMDDINACESLKLLYQIRKLLYQKFTLAIDAFDKDKITFESLQSINFTWNVTLSAIKEREMALSRAVSSEDTI